LGLIPVLPPPDVRWRDRRIKDASSGKKDLRNVEQSYARHRNGAHGTSDARGADHWRIVQGDIELAACSDEEIARSGWFAVRSSMKVQRAKLLRPDGTVADETGA
jgi:hypothetical protein